MSGERTEKASPQKRRKAAEKGDRLVSRELLAAAAMLGGALSLKATALHWSEAWRDTYRASLTLAFPADLQSSVSTTSVTSSALSRPGAANLAGIDAVELALRCRSIVVHCLTPVLFFGLSSIGGALLVGVAQGGGRLRFAAIAPNWSRLNPLTHGKNIFGLPAVVRLGKSLVPAAAIGWLAGEKLLRMQLAPTPGFGRTFDLFADIYDLLLGTAIAMALWSAIDFLQSWRARETRLKMTKQDVKDEMKEAEGSPQIKRRIRQIQRQMRKRQLRADVRKATVVVTNPTHYAVALSFDFVKMEPPRVLAKGRDLIARQIREEAQWAGVPLVENPSLARSLYRAVEPGQSIPFELYAAVAGILAYLYKKDREERAREQTRAQTREQAKTREKKEREERPRDGKPSPVRATVGPRPLRTSPPRSSPPGSSPPGSAPPRPSA